MGTAGVGLPSQIHSGREKQNKQPDCSFLREKDLVVLGQGKENTAHGRWLSGLSLLVPLSVPVDFGKFSTKVEKQRYFLYSSPSFLISILSARQENVRWATVNTLGLTERAGLASALPLKYKLCRFRENTWHKGRRAGPPLKLED